MPATMSLLGVRELRKLAALAAPAIVVDVDAGAVLWANASGAEQIGIRAEDAGGAEPALIALDHAMPAVTRLRRELANDGLQRLERLVFWTPGGSVTLDAACRRLAVPAGNLVLLDGLTPSSSVTTLDPMHEVLSRVSHEIRTPLGAIAGFSEIMKDERFGPLANARYRQYAHDIHASALYALGLLDEMLAQPRDGGAPPRPVVASVDANAVVGESVAIIAVTAERAGIAIAVEAGSDVPEVMADARGLKQILLNVLVNAIKFTGTGGSIVVSTARTVDGGALIEVRDDGIGMSEADVSRLMAGGTGPTDGTIGRAGLGLPLSFALAKASGADLQIESVRGHGTLVRLRFPPKAAAPA